MAELTAKMAAQMNKTNQGWSQLRIGDAIFDSIGSGDIELQDDDTINFGSSDVFTMGSDGTNLNILPSVDNAGAVNIGNGTLDVDVKIFMGSTSAHVLFDNGAQSVIVTATGIAITGAPAYAIDIQTTGQFRMGIQGTGIPTATATPFGAEFHVETNGTTVLTAGATGLSAGIRCRYEISKAQTNQISLTGIEGRLRVKAGIADGCHSGVSGTIEADAAMPFTGTATTQRNAGNFCVELGSACTFGSTSGWVTGVTIDSSITNDITITNITLAGLRIKKSSSKLAWQHGIYMGDSDAATGITIGTVSTAGIAITSAFTASGKNGIIVSDTFTLATTGVHKAIQSDVTYTPATSGYATSIAVAGKAILNGNLTGGVGYCWGIQGQMHFNDAAILNNASAICAAVRAVITADATPDFTAGIICGLYVDNLCIYDMSASAQEVSLVRIANHGNGTTRSTIDSAISIYGHSVTNLFTFEVASQGSGFVGAVGGAVGTHGTATIPIKIDVDGTAYYLLASTTPTYA